MYVPLELTLLFLSSWIMQHYEYVVHSYQHIIYQNSTSTYPSKWRFSSRSVVCSTTSTSVGSQSCPSLLMANILLFFKGFSSLFSSDRRRPRTRGRSLFHHSEGIKLRINLLIIDRQGIPLRTEVCVLFCRCSTGTRSCVVTLFILTLFFMFQVRLRRHLLSYTRYRVFLHFFRYEVYGQCVGDQGN